MRTFMHDVKAYHGKTQSGDSSKKNGDDSVRSKEDKKRIYADQRANDQNIFKK
jgi:hypothetical protein